MKSLVVVLLLCVTTVICESQYYGYALPSGYSSYYRPQYQPVRRIAHPTFGYSQDYPQHSGYYGYQALPTYGRSYHGRGPYTYRTVPQHVPIAANLKSINIPPRHPVSPAKLILPSKQSATPTLETGSSENEVEGDSEKGFKLLDDLVETVSQAAGTATDNDVAEVDAVKSIFADVIDEIIRQVGIKFKENNLDTSIRDTFLRRSETTKKAVSDAPNQTILAAILKPYVADLKAFTAKGFQIAES